MQIRYALAVTLLCAGTVSAQSATTKIAPQNGWLNNLESARALAQKTGKPMMVVFRCDP